jgi:hypothetical protein
MVLMMSRQLLCRSLQIAYAGRWARFGAVIVEELGEIAVGGGCGGILGGGLNRFFHFLRGFKHCGGS